MALRIERIIIDDLDAGTDGVDTHRFALDNTDYEIDLSGPNLQRLQTALAPFIAAGRRLPRNQGAKPTATAPTTITATVRRWWAQHQQTHQLPAWRPHGPIPREVYDAHRDAH